MGMSCSDAIQRLCRSYLTRLRYIARKHGLGAMVDGLILANRRGQCMATEYEVRMLARCVDDERIQRQEIPRLLGKSYRQCNDDDDFSRIDTLPRQGIYSKPSAILYAEKRKGKRVRSVKNKTNGNK